MNETSIGIVSSGGDPPISGGFPPPTEPLPLRVNSSSSSSSEHLPAPLEFEGLAEGLNLTRLLSVDASSWDFSASDPLHGSAGTNGQYRPWEAAEAEERRLASSLRMSGGGGTNGGNGSNVLASPPSYSILVHPPHSYSYQPQSHFIDQRLPSFQSQFQESSPSPSGSPVGPPHFVTQGGTHYQLLTAPGPGFDDRQRILYPPLQPPLPQPPSSHSQQQQQQAQQQQQQQQQQQAQQQRANFPILRAPAVRRKRGEDYLMDETHSTLLSHLRKKARSGSLDDSENRLDNHINDTPGQVAAISSTDSTPDSLSGLSEAFKVSHSGQLSINPQQIVRQQQHQHQQPAPSNGGEPDKTVKKKRKRCGECSGCQKKDNCADCAPCRNAKSHQICKLRRCERLTEKKPRKPNRSGPSTIIPETKSNRSTPVPNGSGNEMTFGFGSPSSVWSSSQQQQQQLSDSWSSHYQLPANTNGGGSMRPPSTVTTVSASSSSSGNGGSSNSTNGSSFEQQHYESYSPNSRRSNGVRMSSSPSSYIDQPSPNSLGAPSSPSTTGFHTLNYNLAVNTETKPLFNRLPMSSTSSSLGGNFQPGFPAHPVAKVTEISLVCETLSRVAKGNSGVCLRMGSSPDSTTTENENIKSFLAFRAEDVPMISFLGISSAPSLISLHCILLPHSQRSHKEDEEKEEPNAVQRAPTQTLTKQQFLKYIQDQLTNSSLKRIVLTFYIYVLSSILFILLVFGSQVHRTQRRIHEERFLQISSINEL